MGGGGGGNDNGLKQLGSLFMYFLFSFISTLKIILFL